MPLSASSLVERVRGDAQVVGHRQLGQQPSAFGHDGDAGRADLLGPALGEVLVAEQDLPGVGAQHAADGQHERATCRCRSARAAWSPRRAGCRAMTSRSTGRPARGTTSPSMIAAPLTSSHDLLGAEVGRG